MFATGTNWSIIIDFLAPVRALVHHETGTRPARTGDLRFEAESVKRPGGGLWGGQNGKKMGSMRIFFEGLIGKRMGSSKTRASGRPAVACQR